MVKSAEYRMRSNLELLPVINVKSRPPIYLGPKNLDTKGHYFDALNEREIGK
jgi:hypothetical protein